MLTTDEKEQFLSCLNELGEMFQDELSELRLRLYLRTFADRVTLDEWQYACAQALEHETFHRVPLPAKLWEYIEAYREDIRRRGVLLASQEDTLEAMEARRAADRRSALAQIEADEQLLRRSTEERFRGHETA